MRADGTGPGLRRVVGDGVGHRGVVQGLNSRQLRELVRREAPRGGGTGIDPAGTVLRVVGVAEQTCGGLSRTLGLALGHERLI